MSVGTPEAEIIDARIFLASGPRTLGCWNLDEGQY